MAYNPIFDAVTPDVAVESDVEVQLVRRPRQRIVRRGAYALDRMTGTIEWKGETLHLRREQRELLALLLERAGQILSMDSLATLLGISSSAVETRMSSLRAQLQEYGISMWLPRRVDGAGYVLWR